MRVYAISLALVFSAATSNATRVPIQVRPKRPAEQKRSVDVAVSRPVLAAASSANSNSGLDLTTVHDLLYIANVTLGGIDYPVQLDTGSSDLWVKGPTTPLPQSNQTATTQNLTYGMGWAYGHISYAPAAFAGIQIPNQAFLDVSSASNPALSYGADGILGLGFTSLSTIDSIVNRTGASTGRSLLFNAFQDNPKEPNFITFLLQRSSQPGEDVQGSFSIGEYEPKYASVQNSSAISTWPVSSPARWNVLLDALHVGTQTVPLSTAVTGAPSNKAVVVLDSGTSYTYAPEDICQAIYGNVPGAKFDSSSSTWTVPCDAEVDIALQFGDSIYPVHPLDVTPQNLADPTTCTGSFIPQAVSVDDGQFDWLIGDNFLRSVYSVYDFGDFDSSGKMGNPYVKLLSIVEPNQASVEFHQIRGGSPNTNITYSVANTSSASPAAAGSTTVTVSNTLASTLDKLQTYIPAMLAVMAFNALVVLLLVIAAFVYLCRRRSKARPRKTLGRSSPMPMNTMSTFGMPLTGPSSGIYQPVSMALTDDTFVPPSPAFSKPGFDGMSDRPKSVA